MGDQLLGACERGWARVFSTCAGPRCRVPLREGVNQRAVEEDRTRIGGPVRRRTVPLAALVAVGLLVPLVGCSSGDEDVPTLTWYINPDAGGQAKIAKSCTDDAEGKYRIETSSLPRDASSQREQLARRLAAKDSSIDIMSLDPPYIAELAEAGFLAPIPEDKVEDFSTDVVEGALIGAKWKDELVTVPFWANTQLLWYRKSVAKEADLDMESGEVTWEQIMKASQDQDKTLAVQGAKAESLTVWLNALVESAGGHIIADPEAAAKDLKIELDSDAGRAAAKIMGEIGSQGLGGAGLPTADENANMATFQGDQGGFMVNWPFVWPSTVDAVDDGTLDKEVLDDIGWALYPAVDEDHDVAPPLGGINLGVGAFSSNVDLAFAAIECIVTPENQAEYFVTNGNPPASTKAYEDESLEDDFPMAKLIEKSLEQAVPRPQTPFYNEVSTGIQETWHPPSSVDPDRTPKESADKIESVLRGESLL